MNQLSTTVATTTQASTLVAEIYKSFRGHEIPEDMYLSAVLTTANTIKERTLGFDREEFIAECGINPETLEG